MPQTKTSNSAPSNPRQQQPSKPMGQQQQNQQKLPLHQGGQRQP
ncbi:hypothetical protein [Trinickia diaoshuihuensis]|nr:hypothetical protein [Trinickia diaoshuihuensis]